MRTESKTHKEETYADRVARFAFSDLLSKKNFLILDSYHLYFYAFHLVEGTRQHPMFLQVFVRSNYCHTILKMFLRKEYAITQEITADTNTTDLACLCIQGKSHVQAFIKTFISDQNHLQKLAELKELYQKYFENTPAPARISGAPAGMFRSQPQMLATATTPESQPVSQSVSQPVFQPPMPPISPSALLYKRPYSEFRRRHPIASPTIPQFVR
jgi:hypothetical protein